MDKSLSFSAVIPAYNTGRFVGDAVQSVLDQELSAHEIIAVNDGSTDDTARVLAGFGDRIKVFTIENSGPAAARNLGLNAASGEWIAFLDADDRWLKNHLARIARVISEHPSADMVYTDAWLIDEEGRRQKSYPVTPPGSDPFRTFLVKHSIPTPSVVVKKSAVLAAGGFLESLRSGQDWDLWLRLARAGPIIHLPEPTIEVRRNPRGLTHTRGLSIRDEALSIVGRAASLAPELPESLFRRARANCYEESGVRMLVALDTAQARGELLSALKERPFLPRAWLLLALAMGGPAAVRAVLAWRRGREGGK